MELFNIFMPFDKLILFFLGVFWALLFLQSGLDKFFDWKGNVSWLKGHFEKSILSSMVVPLVFILAVTELIAGILAVVGSIQVLISGQKFYLSFALVVSMISLLMLFFGQRLAKDYEGAKTIAIYFGVALISAMILNGLGN